MNIDQIANTLQKIVGPIAKEGWEAYVRQQYVIGIQEVVWGIVILLIGVVAAVVAIIWGKEVNKLEEKAESFRAEHGYRNSIHKDEIDSCFWATIASAVVAVVAFLVVIALGVDAFSHFFNPEYGAIQGILGR